MFSKVGIQTVVFVIVVLITLLLEGRAAGTGEGRSEEVKRLRPTNVVKVGESWGLNAINTTIYRHHGLVSMGKYQFTAFFSTPTKLTLVKRDLTTNGISVFDLDGDYNLSDTHNAISLGIDNEGYIHISYAQHANKLKYRRSQHPWVITKWTAESEMTGVREERVTYPMFLMPRTGHAKNNLLFVYRDGKSGNGDVCIKEYHSKTRKWQDMDPCVLVGKGHKPWTSNAYLNHPAIDSAGNIHFSYVWRTYFIGEQKILNNVGIDYAVGKDWGTAWYTSRDLPYQMPITPVNSERIYAVPIGSNLINQTSSATDGHGRPHIVFYANDEHNIPQYQHVWFDGKKWRHTFASDRSERFSLQGAGSLDIPISRPEILIDRSNRIYLLYREGASGGRLMVRRFLPPHYQFASGSTRILWDKAVGYAEPVVDRIGWEQRHILSMYVQKSGPPSSMRKDGHRKEPAYIVDWNIVNDW